MWRISDRLFFIIQIADEYFKPAHVQKMITFTPRMAFP
jgi:hypothetical protein